jgi:hypothetical protein
MQQQQHMAGGMGSGRPPPPEYKAAAQAQMMHASIGMSQQARFANAGSMRRVTQQPMPPSGKKYVVLFYLNEKALTASLFRDLINADDFTTILTILTIER